eukprot:scaffold2542_cov325-Prasinococcus_capsulatus_cf.AAC.2
MYALPARSAWHLLARRPSSGVRDAGRVAAAAAAAAAAVTDASVQGQARGWRQPRAGEYRDTFIHQTCTQPDDGMWPPAPVSPNWPSDLIAAPPPSRQCVGGRAGADDRGWDGEGWARWLLRAGLEKSSLVRAAGRSSYLMVAPRPHRQQRRWQGTGIP